MKDLFSGNVETKIAVCPGMWLLPGWIDAVTLEQIHADINTLSEVAPFRHMQTPGGHSMSVAMTNCGSAGWVTDRSGYRYTTADPLTGSAWPDIPARWQSLATHAAKVAGYADYVSDACLVNRYAPGASMGSHQDKNEQDYTQPIVSVSLGLPARFFVQGPERKGKSIPVVISSGDVIVWGGESRLWFHGVRPLKEGADPLFGAYRYNLTFRVAL